MVLIEVWWSICVQRVKVSLNGFSNGVWFGDDISKLLTLSLMTEFWRKSLEMISVIEFDSV